MKNKLSYMRLQNGENDHQDNREQKKLKPKKKKKPQSKASIMFFGPIIPSDSSDSENK